MVGVREWGGTPSQRVVALSGVMVELASGGVGVERMYKVDLLTEFR